MADERVPSRDKRLDEMNRLGDMAHFPAIVNLGATLNVLLTVTATWWLVPRYPQAWAPVVWVAIVLTVNLLPVVLLRLVDRDGSPRRRLGEMDFFHDQHRFSDWVYVAASANMAFWVLTSWALFAVAGQISTLTVMLGVAFVVTFSPVFARRFSK